MKVKVAFVFTCKDEEPDWKIQKQVWRLFTKLKKYKIGTFGVDPVYLLDQETELYQQGVETYEKNKQDIKFVRHYFKLYMTEEEKEKAVAFQIIYPDEFCGEYEDSSYEHKSCEKCEKKEKSDDTFYVQPKGYIKRHQNDFGLVAIDGQSEIVLLPKVMEAFVSEGVNEKYFCPVFSKKRKILGYVFQVPNVLAEGSFMDPNYAGATKCPECEAICLEESKGNCYIREKKIKATEVKNLKDINCTYEFFDGYRQVIVSPKVQKIMERCVGDALFVPIFETSEAL